MNELGRDVLVQAALQGHPQIRGAYHNLSGSGECVLGVLHLSLHANREEAITCYKAGDLGTCACQLLLHSRYEITPHVERRIIDMNDVQHFDFLTIARKLEEPT